MAENNSISTLLPELLRLFNNSLESFEKVNQAITSSNESVTINIQNDNGTNSRVTIPSFGFLKNSIDRLDNNLNTITNVNGSNSSIRLSDGTFRKLVLAQLPVEAKDLSSINTIERFNIKPNWFFEELINPLLYVSFDLTGQVPIDTERAIIRRYILNTNTQSKINYFNSNYEGRSDINYTTFLQQIVERNISYVLDEAVVDLPPRSKRYTGDFSVLRISDATVTEEINGVTVISQKKQYKLNKIFYTDSEANFGDTIQLAVGDSLEVISDPISTRYKITKLDSSTNTVILELVEGSDPVLIGSDMLKIASSVEDNVQVDVTVGFNERCVTFVKPIDPNSKIPSVNWSPGSSFYTNTLTTINSAGSSQTLADYYQQSAIDFGSMLLSFADDKIPTTREGLKPNSPTINTEDFGVKLINAQVSDSPAIIQLTDLNNQKNTIESTLKELDVAIQQSRTKIQTTNYSTEVERDADKNALQGLITERSSQAELYSSVVKEIDAKAKDNSVSSITPKYRVRGFWSMPLEKSTPATGPQSVVKFKIRYRYLSSDGVANPVNQFEFKDGSGTSQGAFSNYSIIESTLRPRVKNSLTGVYQWVPIDSDNAESVNINQLDIPIRKGEQVEVQVKSISEAGWPSNPLESDWSTAVIIPFPTDLSSDNATEAIINQNQQDLAKVSLEQDLNELGIQEHLSSSFTANETYYAHSSPVIASGFLSENQTPIDLFTKLTEMQNQLNLFSEILQSAQGELQTTLVDDQGNVTNLNRNATTSIFAGFYSQEVANLDDPRGAIISKTFFINIANTAQTGLRLIARISGNRTRMVKQSENPPISPYLTNADVTNGATILPATYSWLDNSSINQSSGINTYTADDADYNTIRKYDLTPILLTNPATSNSWKFGQDVSIAPYQSAQNKNQFLYSRFSDVSSEDNFYSYRNPDGDFIINLDQAENFYGRNAFVNTALATDFFWGGGFDAAGVPFTASGYVAGNDDVIDVHTEHPYVKSYTAYRSNYILQTGDTLGGVSATLPTVQVGAIDCTSTSATAGAGTANVLFRQSKFIPLQSDESYGKQQSIYLNENAVDLIALGLTEPVTFNDANNTVLAASPSLVAVPNLSNDAVNPDLTNDGNGYERNVKTAFDSFDQYLLGKQSCGSYLFVSTDTHQNIQVDGDSVQSEEVVQFGQQNSLNIPLVFQYRMTDYFGTGPGSSGGIGNIAGDSTGATVNVTYTKKLGFDLYPNDQSVFQYDIEVFAKYRSDNLNIDVFPSQTVTKGLNDLEKVVAALNPSVNQTRVSRIQLANVNGGSGPIG
tara:strand:+ start:2177 stop:6070 length:3894 start_codon:yes stop_codon:yes gene_type:complete